MIEFPGSDWRSGPGFCITGEDYGISLDSKGAD